MKVLVVGSGGREDALCWRLQRSKSVDRVFCAPGNPGTARAAENVALEATDIQSLLKFALQQKIDLTVVGPELPLSLGVADLFRANGLTIFGPSKEAARLETSKSFAKEVMTSAGVPTASYMICDTETELKSCLAKREVPVVLKADGLASGKGVFVCATRQELDQAVKDIYAKIKATRVLAEECLTGREVSYIVATDGRRIVPFASSHDYKRIFDGQCGPNTGGMGSVSPSPFLPPEQEPWVLQHVIAPMLAEMERRGTPFCGFLYAGLMISSSGQINVLEFNARMGDPECQAIMRRLDADLAEVLLELSAPPGKRGVATPELKWSRDSVVCVVHAAPGYPDEPQTGGCIEGLESAQSVPGAVVFHAGTARDSSGAIVTAGGRVLAVTAAGANIEEARKVAYAASRQISFPGRQMRSDIGL